MDWDKIDIDLAKKLNPDVVQPPPQGKYGEYIFAWHAIAEANRIFGFSGWSYAITLQKVNEGKNHNGNYVIGYISKCTLTVDGTSREDVGFGEGVSNNIGDAYEGATKEAVSDSLKRALRTFGNQFGLALYDKKKKNVGYDELKPKHQAQSEPVAQPLKQKPAHSSRPKFITAQVLKDIWATKTANDVQEIREGLAKNLPEMAADESVINALGKMHRKFAPKETPESLKDDEQLLKGK